MPLPYFENALDSGYLQSPNDYFRDLQQAAVDGLFDCTSAKYTVKEQDDIGSLTYHDIDVWLDYIVGTTSSGVKNGVDFTQLMFKDIDHHIVQGLYYIFEDNFHISYFYNRHDGLEKSVAVRRCNNAMRIVDPENGAVFTIPCVIDYDMTSPSQQVTSYVLTPNNHASVMVQGNEDTLRLFKLNTRYIFNGRPFKLLAYQNTLNYSLLDKKPTLLYLDLYLDEIHDRDDLENSIAYNGEYDYSIQIDTNNMELPQESKGQLNATVTLNGTEVEREIVWTTSDNNVVAINSNGEYTVVGNVGEQATIIASIKYNPNISSDITITVEEQPTQEIEPLILMEPSFSKIRQFESINFVVKVAYGDQIIEPSLVQVSLDENEESLFNDYLIIIKEEDQYVITANQIALEPQTLYISVQNDNPSFQSSKQFTLNVASMLG